MKKTFILSLVLCFVVCSVSKAQLHVSSQGNVIVDGYLKGELFHKPKFTGMTQQLLIGAIGRLNTIKVYRYYGLDGGMTSPSNPAFNSYTEHYGILPNSLYNKFPYLTTLDENGNRLANYTELVPMLVKSVQEIMEILVQLNQTGTSATLSDFIADYEEMLSENDNEEQFQARPALANRLSGAVLYQNNPNPFSAQTEIRFRLPEDAQNAVVYIFDMTGKTLMQLPVNTSQESVTINGYELSAGMYLYSLIVNGQEMDTKRMILSK